MNTEPAAQLPARKPLLFWIVDIALVASGLVNLAVGTCAAIRGDSALAATSLAAGLILMFASTVDRFELLKGLGVEAKTRALDKKIQQADDALLRIRQLAEFTGAALIDLYSRTGRWDSVPSAAEANTLSQTVRNTLATLGSSSEAVRSALRPWVRATCWDIASTLSTKLHKAIVARVRSLEDARSGVTHTKGASDPEALELTKKIEAGHSFIANRLNRLLKSGLDSFPEQFIANFRDAPLLDEAERADFLAKAKEATNCMLALRETYELQDASWLLKIESHRNE